ncbi:hypothetical protein [Streptomyces candidus]|uniref:Uncharacterized protein n=1 Tax=Streptomyces candidus TaxID=67283 RepID=A0A7X0LNS1_9ACTN|nr:hypothetical protein [Streptomyces candidus]MBB6434161.1 hypothetical protein [Streptomyces candidus]GHH33077.1 hypothetical protein GCM10018773_03090 [Streptomyces candidus]
MNNDTHPQAHSSSAADGRPAPAVPSSGTPSIPSPAAPPSGSVPTPSSARPLPLGHLADVQRRVLTTAQLREHGVSAAKAASQCRAGGPWQQLLPGVFVLHQGPPTSEERLHAALAYATRPSRDGGAPVDEAAVTGLAALALHRFSSAPPLRALEHIDMLVPRTRRLRSTGCVRVVRAHALPGTQLITGLPVAPVARAVADAVAHLTDAHAVRRILAEAVREGHCEPASLVRELSMARLLGRPQVKDAVDALLAEGRAVTEERLYEMVRCFGLPDPVWNVDLRLPGGPHLGGVDAFWPDQSVAVELDTRTPGRDDGAAGAGPLDRSRERGEWTEYARKREYLERLGITVVHLTPRKLREAMDQQAAVVRTALMASADRDPAAYVVVLPR